MIRQSIITKFNTLFFKSHDNIRISDSIRLCYTSVTVCDLQTGCFLLTNTSSYDNLENTTGNQKFYNNISHLV